MLIVGEKEAADGKVAVRMHGKGDKGTQSVDEFIESFNHQVEELLSQ